MFKNVHAYSARWNMINIISMLNSEEANSLINL